MRYGAGGDPDTGLGRSPLPPAEAADILGVDYDGDAPNGADPSKAEPVELSLEYDAGPPGPTAAGVSGWLLLTGAIAWGIWQYYEGGA